MNGAVQNEQRNMSNTRLILIFFLSWLHVPRKCFLMLCLPLALRSRRILCNIRSLVVAASENILSDLSPPGVPSYYFTKFVVAVNVICRTRIFVVVTYDNPPEVNNFLKTVLTFIFIYNNSFNQLIGLPRNIQK